MKERQPNAAGAVVGHKLSMLQDLELGRSLEIDAPVVTASTTGARAQSATASRMACSNRSIHLRTCRKSQQHFLEGNALLAMLKLEADEPVDVRPPQVFLPG